MNVLAFDTCFGACSAAASPASGGDVHARFERMDTGHAERLMPMIAEVMTAAGMPFDTLDRIAVAHGPGSFTGTRIAVAAARAIALTTKARAVSFSSLQVLASTAARRLGPELVHDARLLAIMVDARRDEVYVQVFSGGTPQAGPAVMRIGDAAAFAIRERPLLAGSGAAAVALIARKAGVMLDAHLEDLMPDAVDLVALARLAQTDGQPVKPLYLRPADAKPQTGKSIERAQG